MYSTTKGSMATDGTTGTYGFVSNDNVPMQSVIQEGNSIKTGNWTNGLFGCFENTGLCALTFLAPCVTFGRLADLHGDDCVYSGFLYLIPGYNCYLESQYREKIRKKRGIMDSRLMDTLTILFCPLCALVQEANETYRIEADVLRVSTIIAGAPVGASARAYQAAQKPAPITRSPVGCGQILATSAPANCGIRNPFKSERDPFQISADDDKLMRTDSECTEDIVRL
jgi:Cys-rich protein (TIGR01571 family)